MPPVSDVPRNPHPVADRLFVQVIAMGTWPVQPLGGALAGKQPQRMLPPLSQTRRQLPVKVACYTGPVTGSTADVARADKPHLPGSAVFAAQQPSQQASPGCRQPATGAEQAAGMQQQSRVAEQAGKEDEGGTHAEERQAASEGASSSGREYWQVLMPTQAQCLGSQVVRAAMHERVCMMLLAGTMHECGARAPRKLASGRRC